VKMFDAGKTRMIGLPYGENNCDDMLSRFHLIPERHGRMCPYEYGHIHMNMNMSVF